MPKRRHRRSTKLECCFCWMLITTFIFIVYQYRTSRTKVNRVSHDSYFEKRLRSSITSVLPPQTSKKDDIKVAINVISLSGVKGTDEHNQKRLGLFLEHFEETCGLSLDIHVCPGVIDERRGFGISKALVRCLRDDINQQADYIYIFEDDARLFNNDFCHYENRVKLWTNAPPDAFLMLIGGHSWSARASKYEDYDIVDSAYGGYGLSIPSRSVQTLIDKWSEDIHSTKEALNPDVAIYKFAKQQNQTIYAKVPLWVEHPNAWSNTWHTFRRGYHKTIPDINHPYKPSPKIAVGIPTYNRIGYVQLTSGALMGTFPADDIWVFDDMSTEYTRDDLVQWYGTQHVQLSETHLKADAMARHILEWFLKSEYDVVVLLDSDLLVAPNWVAALRTGLQHSLGLWSLYRSGAPKHMSKNCHEHLCTMPSMGNAGTVWRRDLATMMLSEMPNRDGGFDWGWSEWCQKNAVPMEALRQSAVLHIGMHGSWSHETSAEKAVGFPMDTLSSETRKQAETFLKGAKPKAIRLSKQKMENILWMIPAFKRAWSLDLVLQSLSGATNILVSKDADSDEIDAVLEKYSVDVISHPFSCSRHPNQFPAKDESLNENYKGDTYGNPRSPWATCLKHHWWWMMKQAWSRNPERVCVLEDDTVIHPQAFEWLKKQSGNVKLTPDEIAVPWCMSAKEWASVDPKTFCEHDDYNWDQTIAWMFKKDQINTATVPTVSLSMHVGECGGWDAGGRSKECSDSEITAIQRRVEQWQMKFLTVSSKQSKWLTAHSKPNGGWGHPKDWAHCMGDNNTKSSKKYVVVMPSVKRNNDEYLIKTLDSLERARPVDVPVLLVNANQPATEHTYLRNWCSSHEKYQCIEPPQVQESLISDVISNDKRGDTAQYLRWRTMEATHAIFGMSEFLKTDAEYMIWLQDDVTVDEDLFSSLPNEEIVCLRSDGYCGMVAYMFKKSFVRKLIPKLNKNFKSMPIDWIVDQTCGTEVIRIPKAYHHGIISSNGKKREATNTEAKMNAKMNAKVIKTVDLFAAIDYNAPEHHIPKRIPLAHHIGKVSTKHSGRHVKTGVVLPYYGRHELLKIMTMQSHPEDLVLVQDAGPEFQGFTNVVHSIKHVSHKPIGKSVMEGYDWLYNNEYDIICNLDSDVLVKNNWLKESIRLLEHYPNDIVSAFNEANHLKHCVVKEFEDHYLKNCGGGIHYCFTRELYKTFVQPILSTIETEGDLNYWDAGIVEHVQANGKYIVATKPSRIQHIGYTGFKENYEGSNSRNKLWQIAPDYVLSDEEITLIGNIPELSVLTGKTNKQVLKNIDPHIIKTADLFAAIDYNAPENRGPWKQGWDYDYDNRFKDGLTVHVVPHSHNDPGWIKTYHTYYSTQTRHILDTVVAALTEDPRRTFIWAEISYFSLWWDDASSEQKEQAKKLVSEKRLDFVTGGWVMNDEASVTARATRWHLQEGREWLQKTFGITPQYSWAIDPFGHSAGQAQVLKEFGYKGMLIQRVHYAVKKQLAEKQQLEFEWQTPAGDIFTHMMPFYSYDGPHTCGPDPSVCCQFDFARIGKGTSWTGCPWGKVSVPITDANVAERSKLWLDQVYKKAMLYRGKDVLIPVGDDFRYQSMDEAHKQYTNYQRMFDWISANVPAVKVSFSTLTKYFDAVRNQDVPKLQGSFFPYSDREQDYWTGYFNSRIFYKGYDRLLESMIAAVENNCPNVDIHSEKRALGLFQHHDGITGTAKSHVVQDYYNTMQNAVHALEQDLKTCLDVTSPTSFNPLHIATPTHDAHEIRPIIADECQSTPMASSSAIHFNDDGMITHINDVPIDESYIWRTNTPGTGKAGAYLMSVQARQDVLRPVGFSSCHTSHYTEWTSVFDMITRKVREYHDGTIELVFSIDIRSRNNGELWSIWQPSSVAVQLCSDVHGLTWECHVERKDAPLQAKFWPMPTMAWLDMGNMRLTFAGAQPTGVALHEGAMILMLDRRGNQDDARGLGQGITDSRPVDMRFGVVVDNGEFLDQCQASVAALAMQNWMLNPTIELNINN